MRATEIASHLSSQVEAVVRHLLPNGRRQGQEWRVGGTDGEAGKSMGVHMTGDKAGVWLDGQSGESGDLIGLWMACRRVDLRTACTEAMEFCGLREDRPQHSSKTYRKPDREGVHALSGEHLQWLHRIRNLPHESIVAYKLASRGNRLMFPYLRGTELVFAKYRKLPKDFTAEADCEPILFGWQAIPGDARAVVICEGECFPGDAQVLTREGWVRLADYRSGEVAQYREGAIEWVHPLARIEKSYSGDLLRYETRGYVSVTTPDHNLVSIDHKGREYKHAAVNGANSVADLIPRAGLLDGAGIELSDAQIQFCIAVSADAAIDQRKHVERDGTNGVAAREWHYARFGFRKLRKIERLRSIIAACGIEASDSEIAGGYRSMCMGIPDWVPGRMLPWEWIADASLEQREMMLAELVHWDGNSVPNRNQSEYSSKYLQNAEWVQTLAHSTGRVSSIIRRHNQHGEWFKVSILHSKKTTSWQTLKGRAERIPHDGKVYCVQVPAGSLMVRQEEKITISGNCDAIAWHAYGFPALSVPTGAGSSKWIEGEWDALSVFDTIYLSMDMDPSGQKAIPELCERLGRERVKVVQLTHKDANACLMEGVSVESMAIALRDSRTQDPTELRNGAEYADASWAEYSRIDEGMHLPWKKTHERLKLRAGELSIWAGVNGHGKSAVIGNVIGHLAMEGFRCCVASMEWRMPLWIARAVRQIAGTGKPSEAFHRHIVGKFKESMWVFDVSGSAKAARILEVFAYARRRYQIDCFVIDNLTKCGFADDDHAGQKKFVEALADFARVNDCHVMLVAHMRKSESEDKPSGKMGVKGSGGITDMASTVIEVWRNKPREKAILRSEQPNAAPLDEQYRPDGSCGAGTMLLVLKQNATGEEPSVRLWFDKDSTQFLAGPDHTPRPMVEFYAVNRGIA